MATQTAMKNVLKRVSSILNSISSDMLHVSQRHIDEILSNNIGDVRSAILNLIFVSLRGMIIRLSHIELKLSRMYIITIDSA